MYFSTNKLKWSEARSACNEYGGQLAEIESEAKQTAIAEAKTSAGIDNLWFGLSDLAKEGTFVWESTGKPAVYTNWASTDPNNAGGNEDCGKINSVNKWWDARCHTAYSFVCEKP